MSRRLDVPSPSTVRRWSVHEVASALQKHGLGEVVNSFRKRNIDGNDLLELSEGLLATGWNRELSLPNIRKISKLINDIKNQSEKLDVRNHVDGLGRRSPQKLNRPPALLAKPVLVKRWANQGKKGEDGPNVQPSGILSASQPRLPQPSPLHSSRQMPPIPSATTASTFKTRNNPISAAFERNSSDVNNLQIQIQDALRKRSQTISQANGLSTRKTGAVKPPVPTRPLLALPVAHLPVPPPVSTGQEDEHMKEIVSSIKIPSEPLKPDLIDNNDELSSLQYENFNEHGNNGVPLEPEKVPQISEPVEIRPHNEDETNAEDRTSEIYESINEFASSEDYYIAPSAVDMSAKAGFESTHVQVEELPVAPAVPARPTGLQANFMSAFKPSARRFSDAKSGETSPMGEKLFPPKQNKFEDDPMTSTIKPRFRSVSPGEEKLTVSSELRKSPSSSTSSLTMITTNKVNTVQAASLPDQRLPPSLRPLPPTPVSSLFRSGSPGNTANLTRKISKGKTGINQQPWYHNVDRKRGEELVSNSEDGTFLIRPSTQNPNPYALTIWFGNRVYNIAVRFRQDQKYALGSEKPNEQSFWNIEEMVSYYQTEQLVLYSGGERTGQTSLKSSPLKE